MSTPQQPTTTTHQVRSGESLGLIAKKYGVSVQQIKRWNGLKSNTIRPGQRLTIHSNKSGQAAESAAPTQLAKGGKYKVRSGDTFYSIARRFPGVTAQQIMELNGIKDPRDLKVGMNINIPAQ